MTLYADLPSKDRHSQPDYTNLPNEFKNTTVRLIHDKADIPTISTKVSAAYYLHSVEQVSIKPDETKKINTVVNVHFHQGSFGFVTSQSSMVTKYVIMFPISTIDSYYTGKIYVILDNQRKTTLSIKEGICISQFLIL